MRILKGGLGAGFAAAVLVLMLAGCRSTLEQRPQPVKPLTSDVAQGWGNDYADIQVTRASGGPATKAERKEALAKAEQSCRAARRGVEVLDPQTHPTPGITALVFRCVRDERLEHLPPDPHSGPAGTEVPRN